MTIFLDFHNPIILDLMKTKEFQDIVRAYYEKHGRKHLPWRDDPTPYKVLVSEIMLQQTQVERVIPKFQEFVQVFPSIKALAEAPLGDVRNHRVHIESRIQRDIRQQMQRGIKKDEQSQQPAELRLRVARRLFNPQDAPHQTNENDQQ